MRKNFISSIKFYQITEHHKTCKVGDPCGLLHVVGDNDDGDIFF